MKTQQLKELAQRATPWPWKWFTSNSHNRLSSVPSGKDGDVISAFKAVDGVACLSVSRADMAFIEAAHPGAVIELITSNEILSHEFEETKQLLRSTREKLTRAIDRNVAKDIEIKRLSAVERERDELKRNQELNLKIKQAMHERFTRAEAELARRDAAAVIGWTDAQELRDVEKNGCGYLFKANPISPNADPRRVIKLYTAAQSAVVSDDVLREVVRAWVAAPYPGPYVYEKMRKALGAQPQKPVVLVGDAIVFEHVTNGLAQYGTLPKGKKVTAEFAAGFNYRGEVDKIALDAANVKWELKP
ncbi:hypothetical protein [Erwinia rhapontici]|uniref:hypothetical protein n=1 Tax=Erwinia rhapontici TaxID=55212 RepID=UPI002166F326|nr:hypothetical protein [Erwinia rhapontici]MCS3605285.1 rubrerythrin [Erwinia rhapontici]